MFPKIVCATGGFVIGMLAVWLFFTLFIPNMSIDRGIQVMCVGGLVGLVGGYLLGRTWKKNHPRSTL